MRKNESTLYSEKETKIGRVIAAVRNSTIYKVLFVCDRELISPLRNQSLIERCSSRLDAADNNEDEIT